MEVRLLPSQERSLPMSDRPPTDALHAGGNQPRVERRRRILDRRLTPRGGRRAGDLIRSGVLAAALGLLSTPAFAQGAMPLGFDAKSLPRARSLGMPVS